jgi:glycosyltransferase involved in cell wall biosynthesis
MTKILHVVLYPKLYPPNNGGMLRCWNISKQLSLYFKVDLFCLQSNIEKELEKHRDELEGHSLNFIVPDKNFDVQNNRGLKKILSAVQYRWQNRTFSSASSKTIELSTMWDKLKDRDYDIIFMEHLEALRLRTRLAKLFPNAKIIFDAHNVDHLLLKNDVSAKKIEAIKKQESELYKTCDLVSSCSDSDARIIRELNQNKVNVFVLPNGVDSNLNKYVLPDFTSPKKEVLFCGSLDYKPNSDGVIWFLKFVWPIILKEVADVNFTIVGRGNPCVELIKMIDKSNYVNFIGETEDVKPYYRNAQLAIVPLLHGSGTRLKILEAMSLGVPVVSTSIGGEGINYTENGNICIADSPKDFSAGIIRIINTPELGKKMSKSGRALINRTYCWKVIGSKLFNNIKTNLH